MMPGLALDPAADPSGRLVPGVRKLAVLRANALGDFLVALPALDALRAAYPHAEIVLLGCDWHRQFLDGRQGPVDRTVPVPPSDGVRDDAPPAGPEELDRFFARMRGERFDLAVQLHGGGRHSNPFVRRLGARLTAGLRADDAPPLDRTVPYRYWQHETFRFLEAVAVVGAAPVTITPRVAVTRRDRAEAAWALAPDGRPLVVLHPGATDPRRRWPVASFAAVGRRLASRGARLAVVGVPAERDLTGQLAAALPGAAELCGRLSPGGLAGLLERACLVLGNDSGPVHLAGAVGTATVAVFWCGNLVNVAPLARARRRVCASWRLACPLCGADSIRGGCDHHASFVADVGVDEVAAEALDLFDQERDRGAPALLPAPQPGG